MGRKSLAEQRRTQITEAFYRCIARDGLQNASIREIAKEAGVQTSILHHYFKDRDEMIEVLVKKIVDRIAAHYLSEIGRHKNPQTRFNKAIEFLFGADMINDEHAVFFYDCWSEAKRNEQVRESFVMLYSRFRKAIVNLLIETCPVSELSAAETQELATMIIAVQDGVSLQWDMDRKNVPLKRMAQLTRRLIKLYIDEKTRLKTKESSVPAAKNPQTFGAS